MGYSEINNWDDLVDPTLLDQDEIALDALKMIREQFVKFPKIQGEQVGDIWLPNKKYF